MTWPAGVGTQLRLEGRARDIATTESGTAPVVLAEAHTWIGVGDLRTIEDIRSTPDRPALQSLVGCRGGGYLRSAIDEHLPGERESGSPLYLLLDDVSGTSLIAGFAWSRWSEQVPVDNLRVPRRPSEGICVGFAPGSSALVEVQSLASHDRTRFVPSLVRDGDEHGWHELTDLPPVSMRRARRIDVWREGDTLCIDAAFQDSAGDPSGERVAVHEYGLQATADVSTMTVRSVVADPRILPFMECPSAAASAQAVVGTPLAALRSTVLERLARVNGCTHLNDALRALAEVPLLAAHLAQYFSTD